MLFNIYIANHGKRDGIKDYLAILSKIITTRGHEIVISERLYPDLINIIIDEFSNYLSNEEITSFRNRYPHARLIFVLTEFIESRLLIRSFNFFGGPLEAAVVAAMNVYFRPRRDDFPPPSFSDWLNAAVYSSLSPVYYLLHLLKNWRRDKPIQLRARLHRHAYMHMRYLGLEKMIGCADGVILSHSMIEPGLRRISPSIPILGTLCPEIDFGEIRKTLFVGKRLYIEITGSITPYRQKYIDKINFYLMFLGIENMFHLCRAVSWSSSNALDASPFSQRDVGRGAYSLHPPQSRGWKYSSPTRIFRALQYDHNMPILTRLFNQHPIENLGLVFKGQETLMQLYRYYKDPEELFAYLEPRVQEYMHIATKANDAIVAALVVMAGGGADDSACRQ